MSYGFVAYGQDTTRLLKPVPIFSQAQQNLRLSNLSATVPHFEFSSQKMNELGGLDVGDAVKFIPGIQLRDYGGIGGLKTVSFRSLGAGHTGILVDGSSIPNVQSGWQIYPPSNYLGSRKCNLVRGKLLVKKFLQVLLLRPVLFPYSRFYLQNLPNLNWEFIPIQLRLILTRREFIYKPNSGNIFLQEFKQ